MVVFDVVQIVKPGAPTSTPAGRWFLESHDFENKAKGRAEIFNYHRSACITDHVKYVVERHDESSIERASAR